MAESKPPFHNPFGALESLRDRLGNGPPTQPAVQKPSSAPASQARRAVARAVVRIERSGRGGKEVTIVEHLGLPPVELESWLKAFKSSLGCGGRLEGDALVLQGDQRERVQALLAARGVRKITMG